MDNIKQIKTPEQWLIDEGYPVSMPITRDTISNIISQYLHQHPVPDASQPAAVPDEAGERIKQLEVLLNVTEQQRKEWADMCIKKQARIEELEGNDAVKLLAFFKWFRDNGEKHIGESMEKMIMIYMATITT